VAVFVMGGEGFACVPGKQMRVLSYARSAPTLASGVNIAAFNVGNAIGAHLGGLAIASGLGYRSPLLAGVCLAGAALVLATGAAHAARRAARRGAPSRAALADQGPCPAAPGVA
jgi:DHA1 family inner membrane transport protein